MVIISRDNIYRRLADEEDPIFSRALFFETDEVKGLLVRAGYESIDELSTLSSPPGGEDVGMGLVQYDPSVGVVLIKSVISLNPERTPLPGYFNRKRDNYCYPMLPSETV